VLYQPNSLTLKFLMWQPLYDAEWDIDESVDEYQLRQECDDAMMDEDESRGQMNGIPSIFA
jgi:hypothetical protein